MIDVVVFTEAPTKDYFRTLSYLEENGKIRLEVRDSRFIYLIGLKVYNSIKFLRYIGNKFFGKTLDVGRKVCLKNDILKSLTAYFSLLFSNKIIITLFAPYNPVIWYLILLKLFKRKLIVMVSWPYWDRTYYVHKKGLFRKLLWDRFLKNMDIVTISESARNELLKFSKNVTQIPHSVDPEIFFPGKKSRNFSVIYVGRLIKEKGIRDLIQVAKELDYIEFLIVGDGPLKDEVLNSGLKNVKYRGYVEHGSVLAKLYSNAHVCILNSFRVSKWEELYGIVLLEALSCGTPVISTDCIGPREIVKSEFGILIQQRNKEELKKKIVYMYKNKVEVVKMGRSGRNFILANYDVKNLASRWENILSKKFYLSN